MTVVQHHSNDRMQGSRTVTDKRGPVDPGGAGRRGLEASRPSQYHPTTGLIINDTRDSTPDWRTATRVGIVWPN